MLQVQLDSKNIELQDVTSKELNELHVQGKLEDVNEIELNLIWIPCGQSQYFVHKSIITFTGKSHTRWNQYSGYGTMFWNFIDNLWCTHGFWKRSNSKQNNPAFS